MSIDNIASNYVGLGYGDYNNPSQAYINYSVNDINGPSDVQTFTITDGNVVLPNGTTKYVLYIVKDKDIMVDFSKGYGDLVANGFDKTGQVMILTNSAESTANITIKYGSSNDPTYTGTFTVLPGDSRYLFLVPSPDGTPIIYAIGTNTSETATISGNNNLVYGNGAYLAGSTGATGFTGGYNIAFGKNALSSNTGGSSNIAIGGTGTLSASTTGSYNICIGAGANVNAGSISDTVIIGTNALSTASGQFVLGSSTHPINTSSAGSGPTTGTTVAKNFLQIVLNGSTYYIPLYSTV